MPSWIACCLPFLCSNTTEPKPPPPVPRTMTTDRLGQPGMWPVPAPGPANHGRRGCEHQRLEAQLLVSGQRAQQARRRNLAGPTNPRANQRIRRQLLELQSLDQILEEDEQPSASRQPAQPSRPQQQQLAPRPQPVQRQPPRLPSPTTYEVVAAKVTIGNPTEALLRAEGVETRDFAVEAEEKKAEDQKKELVTIAEELARQGVEVRDWAYPTVEVEREMRGAAIGVVVGEGEYLFGDSDEDEEDEGEESEEGEVEEGGEGDKEERKGEEEGEEDEEEVEEEENEENEKKEKKEKEKNGDEEREGVEMGDVTCSSAEGETQTKGAGFGAVAGEGERRPWGEPEGEYQFSNEVESEVDSVAAVEGGDETENSSQAEKTT